MGIYYVTIAIVIVLGAYAEQMDNRMEMITERGTVRHSRMTNIAVLLIALWMIIVSGHRYYVGTDFGAYYKEYNRFIGSLTNHLLTFNEPGFGLFAKIATFFHDDGTTVLTLVAAITIGIDIVVINKNTSSVIVPLLLFLFLECWHESFNAVRQCLAVSFVFGGYRSLKDGKFVKYLLWVFVGFLCHKSAIVMVIVFFLARRRITLKNLVVLLLGTIVILLSYDYLFAFQDEVLDKGIALYSYVTNGVNILRVLANIAPAVFFLIFRPKEESPEVNFHVNMLLIHAAFAIASANSTYFARITMYTAPFLCISITEMLKRIDPKLSRIAKYLILILFCVFWLYDISINQSLNNFQFIWNLGK